VNACLLGLLINDCDENDQGKYTITIDKSKSSTADVIVETHDEQVQSETPAIVGGFRQGLAERYDVDEDSDVTLQCEVNDAAQVTDWYFNGKPIDSNDSHCRVITDGHIRQLKGFDRLCYHR
jgi:hypothetical protein